MSSTRLWGTMLVVAVMYAFAPSVYADEEGRATVQERFATKEGRAHVHATTTAPVRDDFYRTLGAGLDIGYHFNETLGGEVRWMWLANWEARAAEQVRKDTGFVPDARPQTMQFLANGRVSFGYGKVLVGEGTVVHFDPQIVAGGGVSLAEGGRVVPTTAAGMSLLTHFDYDVQVKLDLQVALQFENRNRGWVASTTFLPTLGFGLNFDLPGGSK